MRSIDHLPKPFDNTTSRATWDQRDNILAAQMGCAQIFLRVKLDTTGSAYIVIGNSVGKTSKIQRRGFIFRATRLDRVIKDVVWGRRIGYVVESALSDGVANQNIQCYEINDNLHDMIRDSPNNTRVMASTQVVDDD